MDINMKKDVEKLINNYTRLYPLVELGMRIELFNCAVHTVCTLYNVDSVEDIVSPYDADDMEYGWAEVYGELNNLLHRANFMKSSNMEEVI